MPRPKSRYLCFLALPFLAGCNETEPRIDATRGASLFAQNCAACHGADARGNGPESLKIGQPAPDLTGLTRSAGGTFPRDEVISVIDGFNRQSHPENVMPEFGAGDVGPTVIVGEDDDATPIPADLLALSNYLEQIQR
ncbi:c-type cytochrome [Roseobacter sp. YSTF-M11]|uniref:C-type cytochrome n=1 Tax=Roseobacter insulae TaxID=2859783 RepID=A0A9X1FRF2_9RHOB|nr:cytochrome c [Roseobacter insulae]MBW4706277.1 c-type cytochrome [Roseobacter insulae]